MTRTDPAPGEGDNPYATPEVSESAAIPHYKGDDAAVIRVRRPHAYFGLVRKLRVVVDRTTVANLSSRQEIAFTVAPGQHVVSVSMDWCRSNRIVEVEAGGECILEARAAPFLLAPLWTFLAPGKLFRIEEV